MSRKKVQLFVHRIWGLFSGLLLAIMFNFHEGPKWSKIVIVIIFIYFTMFGDSGFEIED